MIVQLNDDKSTIVNLDKIDYLHKIDCYNEKLDHPNVLPMSGFYYIIYIHGTKCKLNYPAFDEEARDFTSKATRKVLKIFLSDYKLIKDYLLNKFECPNCHTQGKVFKTGQNETVLNSNPCQDLTHE